MDSFLSNTYLIYSDDGGRRGNVILVDPHYSEGLAVKMDSMQIDNVLIVLTHSHFDHTTGVNWVKEKFHSELICHRICAEKIAQIRNNRPLSIMSRTSDAQNYLRYPNYVCQADEVFDETMDFSWHEWSIRLQHTPGHTPGSLCMEIEDYVFSGDSLIPNEEVMTRFPGGSKDDYVSRTLPYLMAIGSHKTVMPGHGESYKMCDLKYDGEMAFRTVQ